MAQGPSGETVDGRHPEALARPQRMPRISAIVQARIGSTRLPGKVLMDLEGHPMLWWVLSRVSRSNAVDSTILAIPEGAANDPLSAVAEQAKVRVFRGSEADVLDRYYQAALRQAVQVVVRVPADSPFIDPEIIDAAVIRFQQTKADYVNNFLGRSTFPKGLQVEVMSFDALEKAWKEAARPEEREHVTPYIWGHPELFSLSTFEADADHGRFRWVVDYPEDLATVRRLASRLRPFGPEISWRSILDVAEQEGSAAPARSTD